jgi:hypothetical protein
MSHPDPSSSFQLFLERAFQDYERQTGIKLEDHPLARQFETCDSVDSITRILQQQARAFYASERRGADGKVMKSLKSVVYVLHALSTSTALGEGLGLVGPRTQIRVPCALLFPYSHSRLRRRYLLASRSSSLYAPFSFQMRMSL